jgi:hypothetical protein
MDDSKKRGVLITAPDGSIFHLSAEDLANYKVPLDKVESTILEAESHGFVESPQEDFSGCDVKADVNAPQAASAVVQSGPVVHIYIGAAPPIVTQFSVPAATPEQSRSDSVGSSMSKYAAGSAMSKYAAGSAMSKYAAGSAMSKYAAGSTMGSSAGSTITFYGEWNKIA